MNKHRHALIESQLVASGSGESNKMKAKCKKIKSNIAEGKIAFATKFSNMRTQIVRIDGLTNSRYNIVNRFGRCADSFWNANYLINEQMASISFAPRTHKHTLTMAETKWHRNGWLCVNHVSESGFKHFISATENKLLKRACVEKASESESGGVGGEQCESARRQ